MRYSRIHFKNPTLLFSPIILTILTIGLSANAQENSHYAVVGAFAKESNAKKLSEAVRSRFFQSTYEYNQNRKLYYVYAMKTLDRSEAVNAVKNLQQEPEFHDSWVFSPNGRSTTEVIPFNSPKSTINPVPQRPNSERNHHEPSTSHSETDSIVSPVSPATDSIRSTHDGLDKRPFLKVVQGRGWKVFCFDRVRRPFLSAGKARLKNHTKPMAVYDHRPGVKTSFEFASNRWRFDAEFKLLKCDCQLFVKRGLT